MKYYYKIKCKNCDTRYNIPTSQEVFKTFQEFIQFRVAVSTTSFIHNCEGHEYGVGEIIGMEFKEGDGKSPEYPKIFDDPGSMPPGQLSDIPPRGN